MARKTEWPKGVEVERTSMSLPKKILNRARIQAVHEGRTVQEMVAEALEDYLRKSKGGAR